MWGKLQVLTMGTERVRTAIRPKPSTMQNKEPWRKAITHPTIVPLRYQFNRQKDGRELQNKGYLN